MCLILSTSCVFLCMVGSVFPGFLGNKIAAQDQCTMSGSSCICTRSADEKPTAYTFADIDSCETLIASVKDYLILQCSLNCIASGVCFWFVTLLWKAKHQSALQPGFRFPSCNGNLHLHIHEHHFVPSRNKRPAHPPSPIVGLHPHGKGRHVVCD